MRVGPDPRMVPPPRVVAPLACSALAFQPQPHRDSSVEPRGFLPRTPQGTGQGEPVWLENLSVLGCVRETGSPRAPDTPAPNALIPTALIPTTLGTPSQGW